MSWKMMKLDGSTAHMMCYIESGCWSFSWRIIKNTSFWLKKSTKSHPRHSDATKVLSKLKY